jgi:hypothetical protein
MDPRQLRNAIAAQCGFNKAKPYALQVCNAGKMPEDFDSWLKANNDSIPIEDYGGNVRTDRIAANLDQYDERPFDSEDAEEWMRRSEQQGTE